MAAGAEIEKSPFLRQLTSSGACEVALSYGVDLLKFGSDIASRRQAYDTLRLYLQRPTAFEALELLKLWKALFYCMWLTANPKPQQYLAQDFAGLITDTLAKCNVLPFVYAFWETMAREWAGIDSLRMDKYLRLMRLVLRATLQRLASYEFEDAMLNEHNQILERIPLSVEDAKIPNGMRYHVLDIFVDELHGVKEIVGEVMSPEVIELLLKPVRNLRAATIDKPARRRAEEVLTDARLKDLGDTISAPGGGNLHVEKDDDEFQGLGD